MPLGTHDAQLEPILEPAFALEYHASITSSAAAPFVRAGVVSRENVYDIISANKWQDFFQTSSRRHFDNCAFVEGIAYTEELWDEIETQSRPTSPESLESFGRLTHTIQDFYSHSNWIELHLPNAVPVWDVTLASLPKNIVSGTFFFGCPKRCRGGAPTHGELNKDSPDSENGSRTVQSGPHSGQSYFEVAQSVAIAATIELFKRFTRTADAFEYTSRFEGLATELKRSATDHHVRRLSTYIASVSYSLASPVAAHEMGLLGSCEGS